MSEQAFDYVVVGAGTVGCVVAARLSEDPNVRVLVLEAGGSDEDARFRNSDLLSYFSTWGSESDWQYESEPEPYMAGRQVPLTQGKVIGGGSSMNGMMHVRGSRHDYDYWQYLGNEGWSFDQVLPYFKKLEDYEGGASEYRGTGGPIHVRDYPNPGPAAEAFVQGAIDFGFKGPPWDMNGPELAGHAGLYQYAHTEDGLRCSAAVGYLYPALARPNLVLETDAQATRLIVDGTRVRGVEYVQNGSAKTVTAEREVIISAGAYASPKLLMLSGIGPADHLRSHGVSVLVDLPGVGQGLQDHTLVRMGHICNQEQPAPIALSEVGLFGHTRDGMDGSSPDLQIMFGAWLFTPEQVHVGGTYFLCVPTLLRPQSRGTVTLRSSDPLEKAVVQLNWLQAEADLEALVRGVKLAREIINSPAFAEVGPQEVLPGDGVKTDDDLREHIRSANLWTVWHPTSTCKMGRDVMSVVDPQLRVYGVEGVRVADASIMPAVVSGNTNAACLMIGEKAADLVKEGAA